MYNALRYAQAVAWHGSFRRAARTLGISQSQLSRRIQSLEQDLGCALFERDRQSVVLTREGKQILSEADTLLKADEAFWAGVARIRSRSQGELRLCAGAFASQAWLPPAIAAFAKAQSAVSISMREIDWWHLAEAALAGECHLAIGECSEAEQDPSIAVEPLEERAVGFFVRSGHRLDGRRNVTIEQISDFPFAAPRLPGRVRRFFPDATKLGNLSADGRFFLPAIESATPRSMIDVVTASDAVCVMPPGLCRGQLISGQLVELPFHPPWACIRQGIMYARGRPLPEAALAFRTFARAAERDYFRDGGTFPERDSLERLRIAG